MLAVNPMNIARSEMSSADYDASSIIKGTEMMEYTSEGSIWIKPVPFFTKILNMSHYFDYLNTKNTQTDYTIILYCTMYTWFVEV